MAKTQLPTNYIKHTSKNPLRRFLIRNFHISILKMIKPLKINSILDAGCGEGFMMDFFKKNYLVKQLEGVDTSQEAIRIGKINFPNLNLQQADIYKLPYKDNSFDLVSSTEVLEHLEHPQEAIRELVRVSKKYILISVPNEPYYRLSRLLSGINIIKLGDHDEHMNHWGVKSFKKLISENNLKIKQVSLPFPWTMVLAEKGI